MSKVEGGPIDPPPSRLHGTIFSSLILLLRQPSLLGNLVARSFRLPFYVYMVLKLPNEARHVMFRTI